MGDSKGFLKHKRQTSTYRPVCERVKDFKDVVVQRPEEVSKTQASRCMDCGTPFCHSACPVSNVIPEWNDLVFHGQWKKAYELLSKTNPLPEITGRLCPALCEYACVLGVNDDPVTIRENELAIIEKAFSMGWVTPRLATLARGKTGKKVAIIGSGPAGLACAQRLNVLGHKAVVFEKDKKIGGVLRYGIPDFKLEKQILDRRINIWKKEGIIFKTGFEIDKKAFLKIQKDFHAVCLTIGSRTPRDLNIPGRDLEGIYFAMDYLTQQNRLVCRENPWQGINPCPTAKGKHVVVIGGGDTGADCVGVANRQGAKCVTQIELMPPPPKCRTENMLWPKYPMLLKASSSHEEGVGRQWSILTKKFSGENGKVKKLHCVKINFEKVAGQACPVMKEVPGSDFEIEADLIILALGFIHPEGSLINKLKLKLDVRNNILTDESFMSSHRKVFAAGDARRGASLIVWAIVEGIKAAQAIDQALT